MMKLILWLCTSALAWSQTLSTQPSHISWQAPPVLYAGQSFELSITYTLPPHMYMTQDSPFIKVSVEPANTVMISPPRISSVAVDGKYHDQVTFVQTLQLTGDQLPSKFWVHYQLCNEQGVCYMPSKMAIDYHPQLTTPPIKVGHYALALLWAFLGGLVLNIMPCVAPILGLKLYQLSQLSVQLRQKSAIFYMAGVMTAFMTLASILLSLQWAGHFVGWGLHWQNFGFLLAMIMLLFLLSLNLLDLFQVVIPGFASTQAHSFVQGIFFVLMSTPCSAPFLGMAAGYALTQPAWILLSIFMSMALGFSLPWLLLFMRSSQGLFWSHMARVGIYIKKVSAWILLIFVAWLVSIALPQTSALPLLLMLLALAFAAVVHGMAQRQVWSLSKNVLYRGSSWLMVLVMMIWVIHSHTIPSTNIPDTSTRIDWQDAIAKGEPVFINVGAKWCLTCEWNDQFIFSALARQNFWSQQGITYVKVDVTHNTPPAIAQLMQQSGVSGLPLYVYYDRQGSMHVLPTMPSIAYIQELVQRLKE